MAFFVKSVQNAVHTVDTTIKQTTSDTAKMLYGQAEPEQKSYLRINPDHQLMKKKKVKLLFKFGKGSLHWMVFIYEKGAKQCTKCHYTNFGVMVDVDELRHNSKWKEHEIKSRTYSDIIRWCKGYQDANSQYMLLEANCRKFSIRLAEYCNISTAEMNLVASSQYYSVAETVKGTVDGTKDIAKGNVLQGVTGIGSSVIINSAKIVVATGNTVIDTPANVVQKTADTAKNLAPH